MDNKNYEPTSEEEVIRQVLVELSKAAPGSEEQKRLMEVYKGLVAARTEAFRADCDDVNANNRNRVELLKSVLDNLRFLGLGVLSAKVTMYLGQGCFDTETVGAVTSKVWNLLGKKF